MVCDTHEVKQLQGLALNIVSESQAHGSTESLKIRR